MAISTSACTDILQVTKDIILNGLIYSAFQPIVCLKTKSVLGVESLARGTSEHYEGPVPPQILFKYSAMLGLSVQLDRLCRDQALKTFARGYSNFNQTLLFLNLDASILREGVVGSNYLLESVRRSGLEPEQIVIEISESRVENQDLLLDFVQNYKRHGFIIALDDVGVGFSNLDRIILARPDIIKVDRIMVNELGKDCYKREALRCLINMARRIGALTVAEGVETEEEVLTAAELGVDFFQGYYFLKPTTDPSCITGSGFTRQITQMADQAKRFKVAKITGKLESEYQYLGYAENLANCLGGVCPESFSRVIYSFRSALQPECIYVLDMAGKMVTDSIFLVEQITRAGKLFAAAETNSDQSMKSYYLNIHAGKRLHVTEQYISLATGNLNTTVSLRFCAADGNEYILCVDVRTD